MHLYELPVPDTATVRAAREVVTEYSPAALVNHCERTHLFASAYARLERIDHDPELLLVSALLHDLGLEPAFDSTTLPFEEAGGHVAWTLTAGAGWPVRRRAQSARAIVNHMHEVDVHSDPEGHLLGVAAGLDISGRLADRWPDHLKREIVLRHPRLDLTDVFMSRFQSQAARKPASAAAESIAGGIEQRMRDNPLEALTA